MGLGKRLSTRDSSRTVTPDSAKCDSSVQGERPAVRTEVAAGISARAGGILPYVGPARTFGELLAAYRLVHEAYVAQGYASPNAARIRLDFHNLVPPPNTTTFVLTRPSDVRCVGGPLGRRTDDRHTACDSSPHACERINDLIASADEVVGTVTVVLNAGHGVPAGEVFPEELDYLRRQRRQVAEAVMLAHRPGEPLHSARTEFHRLLLLLRLVTDHVRLHNVDDLLILANPHHEAFYRRKLAFQVVAGPRPCSSVCGAPAILLRHDMHSIRARAEILVPEASQFFLSGQPDPRVLAGYRLQSNDILMLLRAAPHFWEAATRRAACQWLLQAHTDTMPTPTPGAERESVAAVPREAVA